MRMLLWRSQNDKFSPAIFFPGGLIVIGVGWAILAKRGGFHSCGVDTQTDEVLADGESASFAERTVIFFGASFVTMALDSHGVQRVGFKIVGGGDDHGLLG